jgi:plastocyanin
MSSTRAPMRLRFRHTAVFATLAIVALLVGVLAPLTASAHDASEAPSELKLRGGINDPKDPNIAVLEFLPAKISVVTSEKVTWQIDGPEPHSVTFVAPGSPVPNVQKDPSFFAPSGTPTDYDGSTTLNSGVLPLPTQTTGATFSMTFSKAGEYTYYCVLHPNMTGTVTVGGADVNTQSEVNAAALKERTKYLA